MHKMLGLSLLLIGVAANCLAAPPSTPEVDPSSATAAVALLAGGLMVIRYRRKK